MTASPRTHNTLVAIRNSKVNARPLRAAREYLTVLRNWIGRARRWHL